MNMKKHVVTFLVLTCLLGMSAPASAEDKALYGGWEGESFGKFVYTFAEKGKLSLTMIFGGDEPPLILEGTYTVDKGKIVMKLPSQAGGELDREIKGTYLIKGDTLTLTTDGVPLELKKVKK